MTHRVLDRVQETTTSTGSGGLTLAGATTRMLSFALAGFQSGDTFLGLIEHATAAEWEETLCTYNAGVITRAAAPRKSSTGSLISFSGGAKTISVVDVNVGPRNLREVTSGSTTELNGDDYYVVVNKSVGGAHAIDLPEDPIPTQKICVLDGKGDAGTNNITVTDPDGATINGVASIVLSGNYERQWFMWTGSKWLLV